MKRIILYEDTQAYRHQLVILFSAELDLKIVGAYENCGQLVDQVASIRPDLVLFDIHMPYVDGLQGLLLLKEHFPHIPALMLTIFDDDEHVFNAVCIGADGYFLKSTPPEKIPSLIREFFDGGLPMTPVIARKVLKLFGGKGLRQTPEYNLTEKERVVLGYLSDGLSYKMVANSMDEPLDTVRSQIKNVYKKLGVHSVSEAVAKAIREGLV